MADDKSSTPLGNAMTSKSSLSQMMMSSGYLENFDEQIMSDIFQSSSSRMFSSSVSSAMFFRSMDETPETSPEKKRSIRKETQPAAPQLLSNADLPEEHDDLLTNMITKSFHKHMSISSTEESAASADEVEVVEVRRPVRLPPKACNYAGTVVTGTTAGSTSSQALTIKEQEVLQDSLTTAPDSEGLRSRRTSNNKGSNGVEILNIDDLARVLLAKDKKPAKRPSITREELAVLDPNPIAPGLGHHETPNCTRRSSIQPQGFNNYGGEESMRFGESMSLLMPDHRAHCAVVTPVQRNACQNVALEQPDTVMPHQSYPGLGCDTVSLPQPNSPNTQQQQQQVFHSSLPSSSCPTTWGTNNCEFPIPQETCSRSFHSSMPSATVTGHQQMSSSQTFHSSMPSCSIPMGSSNSPLQHHPAYPPAATLAPPPPLLRTTDHGVMRQPSLNLSNSSLQTPAMYTLSNEDNNTGNNNSSSSLHNNSNAIEDNPAYVAAAERLTRSMQRSMNSRLNVKQQGYMPQLSTGIYKDDGRREEYVVERCTL